MVLESDSSQPVAPTKEVLSFRLYAARRGMAKLRRNACALYQSEKLADVICKIEREIEHGRLAIRADRHVDADLGMYFETHFFLRWKFLLVYHRNH